MVRIDTVLVAESQLLCRTGLAALFRTTLAAGRVDTVGDYAALMARLDAGPVPELTTLDPALPGLAAAGGLRRHRHNHPDIRYVVVGIASDRDAVLDALGAGAHGYIPKTLGDAEMLAALRAVVEGRIYVPPGVSGRDGTPDMSVGGNDQQIRIGSPRELNDNGLHLTDRQREVLALLVTGQSNKEIARTLHIAESTVKVHVAAAFRLLGVHNRVGAVAALQSGSRPMSGDTRKVVDAVRHDRRYGDHPVLPGLDPLTDTALPKIA